MAATPMTETFNTAVDQISSLLANADENARSFMATKLVELSHKVETPRDTLYRIGHSMLELPMVRFGEDLKLFNILVDAKSPMNVKELVTKTGCEEVLLRRALRYFAAHGIVKETGQNQYAPSNITETLALPGGVGMVYHLFDLMGPAQTAIPDFAKNTSYRNIDDGTNCPFQLGHRTQEPAWTHLMNRPELVNHFNNFMTLNHEGQPSWLDVFPLTQFLDKIGPEQAFMVDVGGGHGHQLVALQKRLNGKIPGAGLVLQDLPEVINMVPEVPGVKKMPQDIFQPQQLHDAKFYYFANVLHDWPDSKAIDVLKNTAPAMGPDSVVLIDEICASNTNVHWQIASLDIMLMSGNAACERTRDEWTDLVGKAGFKIVKIHTYHQVTERSVIEIVPI